MKAFLSLSFLLVGCAGQIEDVGDDGMTVDGGVPDAGPAPVTCQPTRSYAGFGGKVLEADRKPIAAGSDRLRLKPFPALANEYERALGITGFSTSVFATTFGKAPARFYAEPTASANTLYAAFALAYGACTEATQTAATYEPTPTTATADAICRDVAHRAWNRDMTDAEADACASYAVTGTTATDAPRDRWAYTCAAVLTAADFLAY